MDSRWVKGLDPKAAIEFEQYLRNSSRLFNKLREILQEEEEKLTRRDCLLSDFDQPNWAEKQAFRNGDRARLRHVISLLDMK